MSSDLVINVILISTGILIYLLFLAVFVWLLDGWISLPWLIVISALLAVFAFGSLGLAAIVGVFVIGAFVAAFTDTH